MKKLLLLSMCFLAALKSVAGYIEEKDGKTIIHVKVFALPDPSRNDTKSRANVAAMRLFIQLFPEIFARKYRNEYKAHPDIYGNYNWDNVEIQLDKFSGIQVEGVETDLLAIAGGLAPDILYINFRKSDNYIRNSFLFPLDEYIDTLTHEEIAFRINPKLWPVIKRKGPKGKKHVWAIPYDGALGKVLLYRKDLFDEKNIPYPDKNWTWDKMFDACRKITDPAKGTYGFRLGRGRGEAWYWMTFLWSAGGEAMEYNEETDEWRCVFDSREAAVALDYYDKLSNEKWIDSDGKIRRGYANKDNAESSVKWERGEIGMMFSYIDERMFATISPEITGMAPVPLGPTGLRAAELNSRMMGMFSEIKLKAVRDAAWEYMWFWDCKEATAVKTKIMVEGGLGRFLNPKYLRMFGFPEIERLSPKDWAENFEIAIETGKPEPYGKNSNVAYRMMTVPIHEIEQMSLRGQLPEDTEKRLDLIQEILRKQCFRANEIMIGIIPPQEKLKRRICAYIVLITISITFLLVFRKIIKSFTPTTYEGMKQQGSWNFKKYFWAYVLLVPAVGTIFIWQYIPLLRGSVMAFFDYKLLGQSVFVGVDNFANLLFDEFWWRSIWNALRYSFLVLFMTFLPPIILAILLQEVPKGKLLFRIIYYLPAVITGLVTVVLWKQFYDPSDKGMLNSVLAHIPAIAYIAFGGLLLFICIMFALRLFSHKLYWPMLGFIFAGMLLFYTCANLSFPILFPIGENIAEAIPKIPFRLFSTIQEPLRWLSDPDTAMIACVIPMVWAGMGPGCLIYLAALKGIPDDYYEAADIDGATFIDKILFVIFPTLKALVIINFIGAFIQSWYRATGSILVMTGGGANTETAGLHIWFKAFTYLQFGPATAMAWMLGFLLIGFTVNQLKILSRVEFKTAGKK